MRRVPEDNTSYLKDETRKGIYIDLERASIPSKPPTWCAPFSGDTRTRAIHRRWVPAGRWRSGGGTLVIFSIVMICIARISLTGGRHRVMNIMLATVLERTLRNRHPPRHWRLDRRTCAPVPGPAVLIRLPRLIGIGVRFSRCPVIGPRGWSTGVTVLRSRLAFGGRYSSDCCLGIYLAFSPRN